MDLINNESQCLVNRFVVEVFFCGLPAEQNGSPKTPQRRAIVATRWVNPSRLLVTHLRGHDCATPGVIVYEKERTPPGGCENRTIDLVRLSM